MEKNKQQRFTSQFSRMNYCLPSAWIEPRNVILITWRRLDNVPQMVLEDQSYLARTMKLGKFIVEFKLHDLCHTIVVCFHHVRCFFMVARCWLVIGNSTNSIRRCNRNFIKINFINKSLHKMHFEMGLFSIQRSQCWMGEKNSLLVFLFSFLLPLRKTYIILLWLIRYHKGIVFKYMFVPCFICV